MVNRKKAKSLYCLVVYRIQQKYSLVHPCVSQRSTASSLVFRTCQHIQIHLQLMLTQNQRLLALWTGKKDLLSIILCRIHHLNIWTLVRFCCPLVLTFFVVCVDTPHRVTIRPPKALELSMKLFALWTHNPQSTIWNWTKAHITSRKLKVNLKPLLNWLHSPMKDVLFTCKEQEVICTANRQRRTRPSE